MEALAPSGCRRYTYQQIMLYELKGVERHKGEPKRKWFVDDEIDLCVWFDEQDNIIGFQQVYDKSIDIHALTWHDKKGFSHNRVVDDHWHLPNTLVADGLFENDRVATLFKNQAKEIDSELYDFVYKKLLEYQV